MKARRLIDGAAYGPNALKALGQAIDAVRAAKLLLEGARSDND